MGVSFTLSLVDKMTGPAKSITGSMGSLASQAKTLTSAMKSVQSQMTRANALGDTAKVEKLTDQFSKYRAELEKIPAEARNTAGGIDLVDTAMSGLATGAAGAIAAVGALGAGIAALLGKGAALAISASDFKNDTLDAFSALTGSAKVGEDTLNVIRDLEREVPDTEASLVNRAKNLLGQGLNPKQLESTLRSMSDVATAIGEEGAQKVQGIIEKTITSGQFKLSAKQLIGTGVTQGELAKQLGMTPEALAAALKKGTIGVDKGLDALNAVIENKLGGIAQRQVGDFDVQIKKAGDAFKQLFEDVDAGPFLDAFKSLVSVMDQANPSGQFLKKTLTTTFNTVFTVAGKVVAFLKHAFLQLIVWGLQGYIALKPTIKALQEFWAQHNMSDKLLSALKWVGITLGIIAGVAAVLVGGIAAVTAGFVALTVAAGALVTWLVTKVVGAFLDLDKVLIDWAKGAYDVAAAFIDGLVGGIKNGASRAIDAVKNLGSEMLQGVKGVLGIHSPSREMMKLGVHTATGFAQGVSAGNDNAFAASSGMAAAATGGAAAGAGGGGGASVVIEAGAIVVQGASSPQETAMRVQDAVVDLFEKIGLTQGIGTAA